MDVCEGRHACAKERVRRSQDNFPLSALEASLAQLSARQAPSLDESTPSPMLYFLVVGLFLRGAQTIRKSS